MSWRVVVVSNRAKLEVGLNNMIVRTGEEIKKVHLGEVGTLIIESTAVSLTAALLKELCDRKIKVIFCDEKRNPFSELVPLYGSHNCSKKIREQIVWDRLVKGEVWTQIVREKIINQHLLLLSLGCVEAVKLLEYCDNVTFMDETNREGHAAKVYFNALFTKGFTRDSDNPINAALNYGYSIILSAFNREIVSNGYLTQLGLFHDNMFNFFNLSCDLMEPFRPIVDRLVLHLPRDKFTSAQKMMLVNILNHEVKIDNKTQTVSNAIKIYCKSIFDAITEENVSIIKVVRDEL